MTWTAFLERLSNRAFFILCSLKVCHWNFGPEDVFSRISIFIETIGPFLGKKWSPVKTMVLATKFAEIVVNTV